MWQLKTAIKVHLSIAQIKMESVTHFNPHLHIKEKKKHCVNSINFWGIYILASVRTKLCIFQKIRSRKRKTTIKIEEQSLTPQLWRKSSHAGSWVSVVRRWWWASWDIGHALVPRASQLHINVGGSGGVEEELGSLCSPRPSSASDRSSSSLDGKTSMKVAFVEGRRGRGRPPWRRHHPSAGCAAWLLLSFHNFSVTRLYS